MYDLTISAINDELYIHEDALRLPLGLTSDEFQELVSVLLARLDHYGRVVLVQSRVGGTWQGVRYFAIPQSLLLVANSRAAHAAELFAQILGEAAAIDGETLPECFGQRAAELFQSMQHVAAAV